jgi:DNA invertase Pin-like site-specific DNA recombinase
MNGQRIGYIRVSTLDQHIERQLDGLQVDKTFTDKASGKGVRIEFVKEHLTFTGEDSPMAKLMLSVMGAIHEFDRALIKERQLEGIALAKKRGAFKGRKKSLSQSEVTELRQRIAAGMSKAQVARAYGISRETLYKYLRDAEGSP